MTDLDLYEDQIRRAAKDEAKAEMIAVLLQKGLSASTISSYTDVPVSQVNNVLNVYLQGRIRTPEDEEIAVAARQLVKRSLSMANLIMDTGTVEARLTVMKTFASAAVKLVGNEEGAGQEEMFAALQNVLAGNRNVGKVVQVEVGKQVDMSGWEKVAE